jgi:hypothetical protein
MAVTEQVEASIDKIVAKLQADLDAKIDDVNTEAGDAFALEHVPDDRICFGTRSEKPYPFIAVMPGGEDEPLDASGRVIWENRITVALWLEDPDEEALARKLIRFARAVRETIMRYRRPGSSYTDPVGGFGLQYKGSDPGPVFGTDGDSAGAFVSWTTLSFQVQQQQDL